MSYTTLAKEKKRQMRYLYTYKTMKKQNTNTIQHASKKMSDLTILLHIVTVRRVYVIKVNE